MIGNVERVRIKSGIMHEDLNLETSVELDQFIEQLLEQATSIVKGYCRREFQERSTTEKLDGTGRSTIMVNAPIIEITEIKQGNTVVDPDQYRIQRSDQQGINAGIIEHRTVWARGWNNIEITYSHGFQEVPRDVVSVVEGIVVDHLVKALKEFKQSGADSITMDGFTSTFNKREVLDQDRMHILDRYKPLAVG